MMMIMMMMMMILRQQGKKDNDNCKSVPRMPTEMDVPSKDWHLVDAYFLTICGHRFGISVTKVA